MDLSTAKEIKLKDKGLFDKYFQNYPPQISEFTFTNIYMWRNFYGLFFMEWDEHLLLFSRDVFKKRKTAMSGSDNALFFLLQLGQNLLT